MVAQYCLQPDEEAVALCAADAEGGLSKFWANVPESHFSEHDCDRHCFAGIHGKVNMRRLSNTYILVRLLYSFGRALSRHPESTLMAEAGARAELELKTRPDKNVAKQAHLDSKIKLFGLLRCS